MDSIITILIVVVFIVVVRRGARKDKEQHAKRMRKMEAERKAAERAVVEQAVERESVDEMIARVEQTMQQIPPIKRVSKPAQKSNKTNTVTPKPQIIQKIKPSTEPTPLQTTESKSFEFDIERAVIESELLKPKYEEF
jgi:hypothetical protein